jgi:hypothetical protein
MPHLTDAPRHFAAQRFLAEMVKKVGQLTLAGHVHQVERLLVLRPVVAHVQRTLAFEREAARRISQLGRVDPEVQKKDIHSLQAQSRQDLGVLRVISLEQIQAVLYQPGQPPPRFGQQVFIQIQPDVASAGHDPRDKGRRMPAQADRAVQYDSAGLEFQQVKQRPDQHRLMFMLSISHDLLRLRHAAESNPELFYRMHGRTRPKRVQHAPSSTRTKCLVAADRP